MELNVLLVMGIIIIDIANLVTTADKTQNQNQNQNQNPTANPATTIDPNLTATTSLTPTTTTNRTVNGQTFCMRKPTLTGKNTSIPDSFQYECLHDGTIKIEYAQFNFSGNINFKFVEPNTANTTHCVPDEANSCNQSNSSHFIITGCEKGKEVFIALDLLKTNSSASGGKDYNLFTIQCPVNFKDTLRYQAFAFGGTPKPNNKVKNDLPPYNMKVVKGPKDNEVTQAAVGESLRLNISTSDLDYYIKVLNCSASNAMERATKTVELWDVTKNLKTVDSEIFAAEWKYKNCTTNSCHENEKGGQSAAITFYAFRFEDTNVVVFLCDVRFCYKDSTQCLKAITYRKKRGTDNTNHVTGRVTQVLVVTDIRSGSQKPTHSMPMMFSILMVVIAKSV